MKIKTYAPVIIPTLNRYDHFRECLESLEKCTGADKTEVYVALDYPPSDKYVDGWKKVDAYLQEKEQKNNFKSLVVYRRKENYFFSGKGNAGTAIKDLPEDMDRYIFSEDDNIFSPNFLEFINKGLDLYENDDRVVAICGYSHPTDFSHGDDTVFAQCINYSAWGYGVWKKKNMEFRKNLSKEYFKKVVFTPSKMIKVMKTGWGRTLTVINNSLKDKPASTDFNYSILMLLNDKVMLMPVKTLVKNMGWDDLATHTLATTDLEKKRSLLESSRDKDTSIHFDYVGDPFVNIKENNQKMIEYGRMYGHTPFKLKCITIAKFILRLIQFYK